MGMKAVILAGGFGSRLGEETHLRPKPMLEIGARPILWHIMKLYSHYGIDDFVLLLGYKSHMVKDYFLNYHNHASDITIDLATDRLTVHRNEVEPWRITMLETGLDTLTGGRLLRAKEYLKDGPFMLTYGDGVANINLQKLAEFHRSHGKIATITAVRPESRYGALGMTEKGQVTSFQEKPAEATGLINGGFMMFEPKVFDYLTEGDATILERTPLDNLTKDGQLHAYTHEGFWHCMDTKRDMETLNKMWSADKAPWCVWEDTPRRALLTDRKVA